MAQIVDVTITTKGSDIGTFTVTPVDTSGNAVSGTGWPKTAQSFTVGSTVRYTDVPDAAFQIRVQSNGLCTNSITMRFKS